MRLSLKPDHLAVYRDIARLLMRHGGRDLVDRAGLGDVLDGDGPDADDTADAESFARDLEEMGPTFIKLGQLLSTRGDLLPPEYLIALRRLQDDVEPFGWEEVERIVSTELGVRLSKAFESFEQTPVASASLGQVHRARLRDGRPVAVKVQRPDIRDRILTDLDALSELASFFDAHTEVGRHFRSAQLLEEFRRSMMRELDYRQEAEHLVRLAGNLATFDRILVPCPIDDYTTGRVLTMELVEGKKVTDVGPLGLLDIDGVALADQLFEAYLSQILADGFLHADPHPGNVFITDDGRLALIDLGMVAHIAPRMRESLLKLLVAVADGDVDQAMEASFDLGEELDDFDEGRLRRGITELVSAGAEHTFRDVEVGRLLMEVAGVSRKAGLRPPPEIAMLVRALLHLDEVGRVLDPGFDPDAAIRRHAAAVLSKQMWRTATSTNVVGAMLETKEFFEQLPRRINRIADAVASGEFTVNVESFDEERLLTGLHRIANRVAVGVVLAALIIGAALLARVGGGPQILGYPAVAMVFFLAAAGLGIGLVVSIMLDSRRR